LVPPPKHTLNDLPLDVLANHIFSFVGDYQYRFVGGVSRHFENAYRQTFPMKTTQYRMNTIQHAKLCRQAANLGATWKAAATGTI
jgi:hypothetical protein